MNERKIEYAAMNDLDVRADRVRSIVEGNFGKIIKRVDNIMEIELPADIAIGLAAVWGMAGFIPAYKGQTTESAPRRVTDMNGDVIVCENDPVRTAYYRYWIDLDATITPSSAAPRLRPD